MLSEIEEGGFEQLEEAEVELLLFHELIACAACLTQHLHSKLQQHVTHSDPVDLRMLILSDATGTLPQHSSLHQALKRTLVLKHSHRILVASIFVIVIPCAFPIGVQS